MFFIACLYSYMKLILMNKVNNLNKFLITNLNVIFIVFILAIKLI